MHNQNSQPHHENLQLTGVLQDCVQNVQVRPNNEDEIKNDQVARRIHLAKTEYGIYVLLKHLDLPVSWVTLYKTLETAEKISQHEGITLQLDRKSRTAFTNSANNFEIVEFESRHNYAPGGKENKTAKMTIVEAEKFVVDVCRRYVRGKWDAGSETDTSAVLYSSGRSCQLR